ncbi:MAG TPA: hypothetical protein VGD65_21345 [Chryseosolibacter sp.]
MLSFRKCIAARFLAVLTGIIFLNMSFFLTEIRYLGLHVSHAEMVENVVKALAGVGFEEEKDSMAESGSAEGEQIVDLHITIHPISCIDAFTATANLYGCRHNLEVASSKAEVTTPPPKVS